MNNRVNFKKYLFAVAGACLLVGNSINVTAATEVAALSKQTFDVDYYYNTYSDLQAAIGYNPVALYNHYVQYGLREGRSGSEEFNCLNYLSNYSDLRQVFGGNFEAYCRHYEAFGQAEGRNAADLLVDEVVTMDRTLIGSYSTAYDGTLPRATNVKVSTSRINGVTIAPGQEFSFSDTVLSRTLENGYVMGEVIYAGKFTQGIGGGICQVSSTLYAAMVSAGLPATERYPHSLPVDYIPRELESAIAEGYKDLKFVNIFDKAIQIEACANDETGTLTVSLYLVDTE